MSVLDNKIQNSVSTEWTKIREQINKEEDVLRKTFGLQLCKLIATKKENQTKISEEVFGQERQYLSDMISGKKALNLAKMKRLADYFNVPIDYFFDENFQPTKDITEQEICKRMHLTKEALDKWTEAFELAKKIDTHCISDKQNVIFNPYRSQHSAHEKGMYKAINTFIENDFFDLFLTLADIEGLKAQTKLSMLFTMKESPEKTEEIIELSHAIGTDLKTKTKAFLFDFNEQITKILKEMIPENDDQFFRDIKEIIESKSSNSNQSENKEQK